MDTLFKKIFDAIPSIAFVVDNDVRIFEYNDAASDFLHMPRNAMLMHRGGTVLHCVHSKEKPEGCGYALSCKKCVIRNSVNLAFQGKKVTRSKTKLDIIKDGDKTKVYALITASPFSFEEKELALLVIEDISILTELQSLISICSRCHKVRDEKKAWSKLETYFRNHWDVDFSHGLCPDCYEEEIKRIDQYFHEKSTG